MEIGHALHMSPLSLGVDNKNGSGIKEEWNHMELGSIAASLSIK